MQSTGGASLSDAADDGTPAPSGEGRADASHSRASRRCIGMLVALAAAVVVIDQATKAWAVQSLAGRTPVEVLGPVLSLRYVRNPGAAFGLGGGMTVLLSLIAAVIVIVILRTAWRLRSLPWAVGLGLLLGGALGNLLDRLFRSPGVLRGEVVDFLALPHWPVFNVADMAIVSAAALLAVVSLTGRRLDGTREDGSREDGSGDDATSAVDRRG